MICNLLQAMPEAWSYASPEKVAHARGELALPTPNSTKKMSKLSTSKKGYTGSSYTSPISLPTTGADPEWGGGGGRKRLLCANAHNEREIRSPFRQGSIPPYFKHSDTCTIKITVDPISGRGGGGGVPVAPLDSPAWTTKQKQTWTKILNQNHDMQYL